MTKNTVVVEMETFRCPKCGLQARALPSSEVVHRCPANRNKVTVFKPVIFTRHAEWMRELHEALHAVGQEVTDGK